MIQINEEFRLTADAYNVVLQRRKLSEKGKNKGQYFWKTTGHYANYKQAIKDCLQQKIQLEPSAMSIYWAIDKFEKNIDDLKELKRGDL